MVISLVLYMDLENEPRGSWGLLSRNSAGLLNLPKYVGTHGIVWIGPLRSRGGTPTNQLCRFLSLADDETIEVRKEGNS